MEVNPLSLTDASGQTWESMSTNVRQSLASAIAADDACALTYTSFYQQQAQGELRTQDNHFDLHREEYQEWRRLVRRLHRVTTFTGIANILAEASAYRAARRMWPKLVLAVLPDRWYRGTPEPDTQLNLDGLLVYVREFLSRHDHGGISTRQSILLVGISPFVTPFEQQGEDSLYMIVDPQPEEGGSPVLLLEDHWAGNEIVFWSMRIPESLWTHDLLRTIGRLEECLQETIECTLKYNELELPQMVSWQSLPGMKLNLEIVHSDISDPSLADCTEELGAVDTVTMMQLPTDAVVLGERRQAHQNFI